MFTGPYSDPLPVTDTIAPMLGCGLPSPANPSWTWAAPVQSTCCVEVRRSRSAAEDVTCRGGGCHLFANPVNGLFELHRKGRGTTKLPATQAPKSAPLSLLCLAQGPEVCMQ